MGALPGGVKPGWFGVEIMAKLPQVTINTDMSDGLCFGCGQNNPIGLKLSFRCDGNNVVTEFTPQKHHQGWPGVVHGGIIASVLDEALSYAAHFAGLNCLTAKMEVKLKCPAYVDEPLFITSSIARNSRKLIETKARVSLPDGTLIAEGKGVHYVIERKSAGMSREKGESQSDV